MKFALLQWSSFLAEFAMYITYIKLNDCQNSAIFNLIGFKFYQSLVVRLTCGYI